METCAAAHTIAYTEL